MSSREKKKGEGSRRGTTSRGTTGGGTTSRGTTSREKKSHGTSRDEKNTLEDQSDRDGRQKINNPNEDVQLAMEISEREPHIAEKYKRVEEYRGLTPAKGDKYGSSASDRRGWKKFIYDWEKHGIIERKSLEEAYMEASAPYDVRGNKAQEGSTVTFWSAFFKGQMFYGLRFFMDSQWNPGKASSGPGKAVDLNVNYKTIDYTQRLLLLVEAKRHPGEQGMKAHDVLELEVQLEGYGNDYLEKCKDVEFIYLASVASTSCRLWIMKRHEKPILKKTKEEEEIEYGKMVGMWYPEYRGNWQYYKDVGLDCDKKVLYDAFDEIKENPPLGPYGETSSSEGTRKARRNATSLGLKAASTSGSDHTDMTGKVRRKRSISRKRSTSKQRPERDGSPHSSSDGVITSFMTSRRLDGKPQQLENSINKGSNPTQRPSLQRPNAPRPNPISISISDFSDLGGVGNQFDRSPKSSGLTPDAADLRFNDLEGTASKALGDSYMRQILSDGVSLQETREGLAPPHPPRSVSNESVNSIHSTISAWERDSKRDLAKREEERARRGKWKGKDEREEDREQAGRESRSLSPKSNRRRKEQADKGRGKGKVERSPDRKTRDGRLKRSHDERRTESFSDGSGKPPIQRRKSTQEKSSNSRGSKKKPV